MTSAVYLVAPVIGQAREKLWVLLMGCLMLVLVALLQRRPRWKSLVDRDVV